MWHFIKILKIIRTLHILKICKLFSYNYYSKTVLRLVAGSGSDVTEATTKHEAVISMGILG